MPRLFLALFAIVPLSAQLIVDTYAGGAIPSGVPAQNVLLGTISGLTWDLSGNIVFCDTTYNVIRRVGTDGILETIAGTGVTGIAGDGGLATAALINFLQFPSSLQYDPSGNLYFFDSGNYRIRRIDTSGIVTTIAGDGQAPVAGLDVEGPATARSLPSILSFAIDPSGILYIAEQNNNVILRLTAAGNLETFAQVTAPRGLATDESGNVYVSSPLPAGFGSILRISPTGAVATFVDFPSTGTDPYPNLVSVISTDAEGNVYVVLNGELLRYAPDGARAAVPTSCRTYYAATDPRGNLAFACSIPSAGLSVIQTLTTESISATVAGGNPQAAPDGTPLRDAWFLGPLSIAFSHAGDLYIAEWGACLIRKISPTGVLSTFAGTGTCGGPPPSGAAATANLAFLTSIAVDSKDDIWVADPGSFYSISQAGAISAATAIPFEAGAGQLAIDAQDRVYVLGIDSLYRLLASDTYQTIVLPLVDGGSNGLLSGIGADSSGNVYFGHSEPLPPNLYVVNNDATFTLKVPNFGGYGFAFDTNGNVWGSNVSLTTSNSTGVSNVGLGGGFAGDGGPAQSALMKASGSIAFGPDSNLYFVDGPAFVAGDPNAPAGYRIRRVTGSGPSVAPVISQNGIVNAASYGGGPISPGELISIFGSNFGASSLQVNSAPANVIPRAIGRTKVVFNISDGAIVPGVITAITPNQINVFVPYEVTPGTSVNVQVQVDNILSTALTIPAVGTAPGLSTLNSGGSGPGAILNQDGTLNGSTNPAPRGSVVSLYGTGLGRMTPQLGDGYLAISTPYSIPVNPISVTIGGQPATILYAGDAPSLPTGVFQINATIPANISTGPAAISVGTIGGSVTSQQVTVAVK